MAPGVKAPQSGSSSSPLGLDRFRRPVKVLPCCSLMTSVVRPPRRPSSLAIRSRWPVHVPTSDTESAPSTGVVMRMAMVVEYKRAFIIEPPCVAHNQYSFLTCNGQLKSRAVALLEVKAIPRERRKDCSVLPANGAPNEIKLRTLIPLKFRSKLGMRTRVLLPRSRHW